MNRGTILFVCALCCVLSISFADDYYWNDPAGGEMGDSTKWDLGIAPGVDDYVHFNLPNTYTVWLDDYYTHDRLLVEGSDLTLDLNGYEYTLDGTADYDLTGIIGDTVDGSVTAFGGGIYSGDLFLGRNDSQATGRLNLSGAGTYWIGYINDGYHGFFYGNSGDAAVSVTDNAYLEHGHGQSGIYRTALFDVDGTDSEWFVAGFFGMSYYGDTTLNLSNGGRARYGCLEMAVFPGSSAVINVTGVGHESELVIENGWSDPIGLFIGREGEAVINLTGSKLNHTGNTVIGQNLWGQGELNIYEASWANLEGSVAVGGSMEQPGGEGLIYLYDDPFNGNPSDLSCGRAGEGYSMVVWPGGTIRMDAGNIWMDYDPGVAANPILLKGGSLEGWGSIYAEVNNESGVVAPGTTGSYWKALELKYNYVQGPEGTLRIGLRGPSRYWDYGVLVVTEAGRGQVTLDGFLDVDLRGGYVPNYEDVFWVVQGQSITGQFVNAPSQVIFEEGTFDVIYSATEVTLTHFTPEPKCPACPAADFNKDCLVNLSDLAVMSEQWLRCGYDPDTDCP